MVDNMIERKRTSLAKIYSSTSYEKIIAYLHKKLKKETQLKILIARTVNRVATLSHRVTRVNQLLKMNYALSTPTQKVNHSILKMNAITIQERTQQTNRIGPVNR